jgi:hypothetical protein
MCCHSGKKIKEPDILSSVVTCNETWLFQYDAETKQQSVQWKSIHSPRPKKARMSRSKLKTMLFIFFGPEGIVMSEYIHQIKP